MIEENLPAITAAAAFAVGLLVALVHVVWGITRALRRRLVSRVTRNGPSADHA